MPNSVFMHGRHLIISSYPTDISPPFRTGHGVSVYNHALFISSQSRTESRELPAPFIYPGQQQIFIFGQQQHIPPRPYFVILSPEYSPNSSSCHHKQHEKHSVTLLKTYNLRLQWSLPIYTRFLSSTMRWILRWRQVWNRAPVY